MNITFTQKEFRYNQIQTTALDFAYLISIKNQSPDIWKQFKKFIKSVDEHK